MLIGDCWCWPMINIMMLLCRLPRDAPNFFFGPYLNERKSVFEVCSIERESDDDIRIEKTKLKVMLLCIVRLIKSQTWAN